MHIVRPTNPIAAFWSCDPPICSYLVSFLLDSTIGLLIIYVLLKAVAWVVAKRQVTPLVSGEYGKPAL
jgi:hypothetical protein